MNLLLLRPSDFRFEPRRSGACLSGRVRVEGARARHLRQVLRVDVGQELHVGLVDGALGIGTVALRDGGCYELVVRLDASPPPALPVKLVLALPRPKVLGRVLRTVTALGVKDLVLLNAQRVERSYWDSHRLSGRTPRALPASLTEPIGAGLEQARDTIWPRLRVARYFRPFVEDTLPAWSRGTRRLLAHPGDHEPCPNAATVPTTVVVGPEGGWVDFEVELLQAQGFRAVSLGPRVLHVEAVLPWLLSRLSA